MSHLLELKSVSRNFRGIRALDNVSIDITGGKVFGLIGPNGSGKSTLINVVTGIFRADSGSISFNGLDITRKKMHSIAKAGIGRTFQVPRFFPNLTVREHLLAIGGITEEAKPDELLNIFGLTSVKDIRPTVLGYGQRKQLELARVMALNPSLIMLDEPMAGLDSDMIKIMSDYIRSLNRSFKKTILIVEHHLEELMSLCDHVFVLDHGSKIYEGAPEEIKRSSAVLQAYFGKS